VVDDPGRDVDGLPGGFRFDLEGIPAQPVNLVDDGYVRDLLLTRVPRSERVGSNGHARGLLTGDWAARLSVWEVRADRNVSVGAFQRQVSRTMKGAGLDRILVVRGLQAGKAGSLPRPTDAVWLADDGSEQPVLSLQFSASDRRTLRDIAAAGGGQQVHPYLDAWSVSGKVSGDTGLPTVLIAPARLLVEDLEAVFPGPSERPHALPPPG
jgi:hypothetical protein